MSYTPAEGVTVQFNRYQHAAAASHQIDALAEQLAATATAWAELPQQWVLSGLAWRQWMGAKTAHLLERWV